MTKLKIALLQLEAGLDKEENLKKGLLAVKKAKEEKADICLFPEVFSNGYSILEDVGKMNDMAIFEEDDYLTEFQKAAKDNEIAIAITFLEKTESLPANTVILFDRFGKKVYTYRKVHTCDFDVERNLLPGETFYVEELDTAKGTVKVGSMICYDREFPESARIMMLKGAELVLVNNACPMELYRLTQLRARAFENMMAIATCNYPSSHIDCNGHSTIYTGIAWKKELDFYDNLIIEAGEEEGIYYGEIDLDELREYRQSEVMGNAYRHPQKYGMLIDEKIENPFIRKDYRK